MRSFLFIIWISAAFFCVESERFLALLPFFLFSREVRQKVVHAYHYKVKLQFVILLTFITAAAVGIWGARAKNKFNEKHQSNT